ncbi:MAG: alpha/beta fold hydrolase [Anaerolineales bacterium]|nr:alpha/beta fold hydrolase [Anaerolineales bacterium]
MPVSAGIAYRVHVGGGLDEGRPPLILIHGAGGTRLHWPTEVRRLPGEHVYSLDLPGHGGSPGAGEMRIGAYVEQLKTWLDAQEIERGVFVGHSMGGAISLTMALGDQERVAGLVLVGTGGRLRVHPEILAWTAEEKTFPKAVDMIKRWAFSPQASSRLVTLVEKRMGETPPAILHGDFLACDAFDILDRLGEVHVPAQVIVGTDDKMTPVKYSRYLEEHLPDARLEIIEGAGHMVMLERPGEVADVVKAFLESKFG